MANPVSNHPSRPVHISLVRQFARSVSRLLSAVERERRVRTTIDRLSRLNDRTLRDIGLERDAIEEVVRHESTHW